MNNLEITLEETVPATQDNNSNSKPKSKINNKLFGDENINSFFRRCCWTPDGSFLLLPAGIYQSDSKSEIVYTSYLFARNDLHKPAIHYPVSTKPTICIRCNPNLFQKKIKSSEENEIQFKLPYRIVFAVATLDSILLYDTQNSFPISVVQGIHCAQLTDIAWSFDGNSLVVSSIDGYCTVVNFSENELGEIYHKKTESVENSSSSNSVSTLLPSDNKLL